MSKRKRPYRRSRPPKKPIRHRNTHHKSKRNAAAKARASRRLLEAKRQRALADLAAGKTLDVAANANGLTEKQLRDYADKKGALTRRETLKRNIARKVMIYSDGVERTIVVGTHAQASLVGKYMSAVQRALLNQDLLHLVPFEKTTVVDINGKRYPLETRPKALYRLSHSGGPSFEQIYRIVV